MTDTPAEHRIERISTRLVSFPLRTDYRSTVGTFRSVDYILCTVTTADGAAGLGYAMTFGLANARVIALLIENLGAVVRGGDGRRPAARWETMYESLAVIGQSGPGMTALSAIDLALWDRLGKAEGRPLHALLDSEAKAHPVLAGGGALGTDILPLAAEFAALREDGFAGGKMKIGSPRIDLDAQRVAAVREAVGPDFDIVVDANQRWLPSQAIAVGKRLAEYDLAWFEEPVACDDVDGLAAVAAALELPIASGESDFTPAPFRALVAAGAVDILNPNVQRVGGVTGWRKVAALAERKALPMAAHLFPEVSAHLLSSIPSGAALEVVPWLPTPFAGGLVLKDGMAEPSPEPGIGLVLDDDRVVRYTLA